MTNILNSSFKAIFDDYGNPATEYTFSYNCNNEIKTSSIMMKEHISLLTEDKANKIIEDAENHIIQRRNAD